jgi:hypothetical protein
MKKLINPIITFIVLLSCLYVISNQNKSIISIQKELKVTQAERDSLTWEMTTKEIEVGRYEAIFERAEGEMSPDCKQELEKILHETE